MPFFRKEILRTNVKYKLLCGSSTAQRMEKGREGRELGILKCTDSPYMCPCGKLLKLNFITIL